MDDGFFNFGDFFNPKCDPEKYAADLLLSRDQGDSEQRRSDLLLHIHQLEQAIRLLHNLAHLDIIQWLSDVSDAFQEVYQELFHSYLSIVHGQNNEVIHLDMTGTQWRRGYGFFGVARSISAPLVCNVFPKAHKFLQLPTTAAICDVVCKGRWKRGFSKLS